MRTYSALLHFYYKLENHYLLQISLRNWLWALVVAPTVVAGFGHLSWSIAVPLSLLGAALLSGAAWIRTNRHRVFDPAPFDQAGRDGLPLQADESIAGWTCGTYQVEGKRKYLFNERAHLAYVSTREHVVMALVQETRFLLLATSLRSEAGCWYVFFMPSRVEEVTEGYLTCGFKTRPGLAIRYRSEDGSEPAQTVYLAFPEVNAVKRVLADLRLDVPPQAFTGA